MTEIWLAGAILLALLAIVRSSLLTTWWRLAIPALLTGLWVWLTYGDIARKNLAQIYAPLAQPDALALILMIPIAESIIGMRSATRHINPAHKTNWWQQMLALTPYLSLFAALRLLIAQAFQFAPSGMDFDTFGLLLALAMMSAMLLLPQLLQWLLPVLVWRVELYLLLRAILLLGIFAGYAFMTLQPVPPPDASFSWKGTGIVLAGMCAIALIGAVLSNALHRVWRKFRLTTDYVAINDN